MLHIPSQKTIRQTARALLLEVWPPDTHWIRYCDWTQLFFLHAANDQDLLLPAIYRQRTETSINMAEDLLSSRILLLKIVRSICQKKFYNTGENQASHEEYDEA